MRTFSAHFAPEAWSHDVAVPVDADGPTHWDCTAFVTDDVRAYLDRLDGDLFDHVDGVLDVDDRFKLDPAAPQWVRDWAGPFTIRVYAAD